MINFYFFGDSICFGQYVSIEKTWVCRVALELNEKFQNRYTILNPSIIGNTTRDALNRFHNEVLFRQPSIIYIQFGMNDCNVWEDRNGIERVTRNCFESNLKEMCVNAKAFNVKNIMLGTNHPSRKNKEYDLRNHEYNQIIRKVSAELDVFLIDNENFWLKGDHVNLLLPDGIHLSEIGHYIYYRYFMESIKFIL